MLLFLNFLAHGSIEYEKFLNKFIWPIDVTLTGMSTSDQSRHKSNGNEKILHTFQFSWTGASPSDSI